MLPPYHSEDIAQAVQESLGRVGISAPHVVVTADLRSRRWIVLARWEGGEHRASYRFAGREGIHTPAELAGWFARDVRLA